MGRKHNNYVPQGTREPPSQAGCWIYYAKTPLLSVVRACQSHSPSPSAVVSSLAFWTGCACPTSLSRFRTFTLWSGHLLSARQEKRRAHSRLEHRKWKGSISHIVHLHSVGWTSLAGLTSPKHHTSVACTTKLWALSCVTQPYIRRGLRKTTGKITS